VYFASHYAPTTIYALTQDGVDISARRDVGCFRDTCYDTYPGYSIYLPSSQEQPGSGGVADCNVDFGVYLGSKVYDLRADGTRGDGTRTGDTWTQAAVIPTGALQDQPIFCQYGGTWSGTLVQHGTTEYFTAAMLQCVSGSGRWTMPRACYAPVVLKGEGTLTSPAQ